MTRFLLKARFGDKLSTLRKSAGLIMIPLLVDPNTDTIMVESLFFGSLFCRLTFC
jgi:hypothetical protein